MNSASDEKVEKKIEEVPAAKSSNRTLSDSREANKPDNLTAKQNTEK